MKTSSSRFSHRPDQRHTNAGQIQGGMVTDADLVEAGQLHQARDEAQSRALVRSGTPAEGGIVDRNGPKLRLGTVFAQGRQGRLVASAKLSGDPLDLYTKQADLPLGPAKLPEGEALVYADLWDRTIRAQQDPYLADAGLHGAETGFRTRTMVQIKALPAAVFSAKDARERLAKGAWPFCATGDATAKLTPKNLTQDSTTADPCADKITAERQVPNALWRLEAIAVAPDPATGEVRELTLAWSLENAAALETVETLKDKTAREAFERDTAVYEFLSEATEAQIGAFPDGHKPERPVLTEQLFPAPVPAPDRNGGKAFDLVRRWNGAATFKLQGNAVAGKLGAGATDGVVAIAGGTVTIDTDAFTVEIALTGKVVLAGDYWLVELRRFAAKDDRLRLVNDGDAAGPRHHFCDLFEVKDGAPKPLTKADLARLDFPSLTSLQADRVQFEPDCDDLFGDATTVHEALNKLCDLDAKLVDFTPPPNCDRFTGAKTVQEALEKLCKIEDSLNLEHYLRLTADWGVLCGIDVTLQLTGASGLKWSRGAMLDRKGRLIDVDAGSVNLLALPDAQTLGGTLFEIASKYNGVCFALAAETADGPVRPFLCDPKTAFGPSDPGYAAAVKNCESIGRIDFGKVAGTLTQKEKNYLEDSLSVWNKRGVLAGSAQLDDDGGKVMKKVTDEMLESYLATFEGAEKTAETAKMTRLFKEAETKYDPNRNAGMAENVLRMNLAATKIGILALAEKFWRDNRTCACRHLTVPCPPDPGNPPFLVPAGRVFFNFNNFGKPISVASFDPYQWRKQAMTWRSRNYFLGSFTRDWQSTGIDKCAQVPEERDLPDITVKPPVFEPPIELGPWFIDPDLVEPDPKWPPRGDLDVVVPPLVRDPGLLGAVRPSIDSLKVEAAKDTLEGAGFKISEVIDTGTEDALAKVKALRDGEVIDLAEGKTPKPGDTVALITSGGNAIDFVLIKEGTTKQKFETTASLTEKLTELGVEFTRPTKDVPGTAQPGSGGVEVPDLSGLRAELADMAKARDTITAEIASLSDSRDDLLKTITDAKTELATLGTQRDAAVKSMTEILTSIEKAREEQAKLRTELRRDLPLEAVVTGNAPAVKALREAGLVSLRDIEGASAGDITRIMRNAGVTNLNGSTLRTNVTRFIER
jgi:hypothetical protein